MDGLIKDGRLLLHAGRIGELRPHRDGIAVGLGPDMIPADLVIYATGPNLKLSSHPLLRRLLESSLIAQCPLGLDIAVDDSGRCLTRAPAPSELFALGTLTRGCFFETVAIPHIRKRAADIAAAIENA